MLDVILNVSFFYRISFAINDSAIFASARKLTNIVVHITHSRHLSIDQIAFLDKFFF